MRRLIDNLVCILVTICMFAFPVMLLGLAPWFGDSLIGGLHIHFGTSLLEIAKGVILMMSSAGGALLLAVPVFMLVWFLLTRATRFSTWLLSAGQMASEVIAGTAGPGANAAAPPASQPAAPARPIIERAGRQRAAGNGGRTDLSMLKRRRG